MEDAYGYERSAPAITTIAFFSTISARKGDG